jgi:hypothetical protein
MKAMVVVFSPACNGQEPSEQSIASRHNGAAKLEVASDRPKTDLSRLPNDDQKTPPFWTWFLENPRRVGV